MIKILNTLLLVYACAQGNVHAQNAVSSLGCKELTDTCNTLSLQLVPTNRDECNNCHVTCSSAKTKCHQDGDNANLQIASGAHLYCTNSCKNTASK